MTTTFDLDSHMFLSFMCSIVNRITEKTIYDPTIPLGIRDKNTLFLKHKLYIKDLQDLINKEKKKIKTFKKKNLVIKDKPEKPKKLVIVNFKLPRDFNNEYEYFAYTANQLNTDYYKYKSSCLWEGPAIILDLDITTKAKIQNIKNKFKIELNYDFLNFNQIALFPKKSLHVDSIDYELNYNYPENKNNSIFEVIEWCHNDIIYLLDKENNDLYDFNTEYHLGNRYYDNTYKTWKINYN